MWAEFSIPSLDFNEISWGTRPGDVDHGDIRKGDAVVRLTAWHIVDALSAVEFYYLIR